MIRFFFCCSCFLGYIIFPLVSQMLSEQKRERVIVLRKFDTNTLPFLALYEGFNILVRLTRFALYLDPVCARGFSLQPRIYVLFSFCYLYVYSHLSQTIAFVVQWTFSIYRFRHKKNKPSPIHRWCDSRHKQKICIHTQFIFCMMTMRAWEFVTKLRTYFLVTAVFHRFVSWQKHRTIHRYINQ